MSPPQRHITLGGYHFSLDENEERPFRRAHLSLMVPRTEVSGLPGAENLDSNSWLWTMTDFSGGEGRLVFDRYDNGPPHFKATDDGIDVRTRGEFKMSPVSALVLNTGGTSTTTTQGSSLVTDTGSPVIGPRFPVVESRAESESEESTSHVITLPSGVAAGDLLFFVFAVVDTPTVALPSGYTSLGNDDAASSARRLVGFYRRSDGTEGATITVTTSSTQSSTTEAYRISGAENPSTQAPEKGTAATGTNSPDPPSLPPTGGSKNYLWLAATASSGEVTAAPASYSNLQAEIAGEAANSVAIGVAERSIKGSSEDPGTFTSTGTWVAQTYAIHPPAVPTSSFLDAVEGVRVASTPGATAASVTVRFIAYLSGSDSATLKLRIFNNTDTAAVSNTTLAITAPESGIVHDLSLSYTALAAKEYHYIAELSAASGLDGITDYVEVDYIAEVATSTPNDVRLVQMGYDEEVIAMHWDGTNIDTFKWDFTNSEWDAVQANAINSLPVAHAASDKYNYTLCANKIIYQWTTGAFTAYTAADPSTSVAGMCISSNRIYLLGFGATRYLHEIALDQTSLPLTEDVAGSYERVASAADYPDEESHDTTLRQVICAVPGGCRFITNAAGGVTEIWEYSDNELKPIATLEKGYRAHSIHHYGANTYIGVQFTSRATNAETRSGAFVITPDGSLRPLGIFRFHDPDDERVAFIESYDNHVYFLQGKYLWAYDTQTGGITLDTVFGPGTDSNARSFAVMDTKKWACYSGEGVHVTQTTYPVGQSVYLYSPIWDYAVPDKNKKLLDVTVITKPLSANTSVSLDYQDNEDGTWTTISAPASASTTGSTTHTFKVWGAAASPANVDFRNLQWRVGLRSSDGVSSPVVRSITARVYVLEYVQVFDLALKLTDDTSDHHPPADQYSGRNRAELLWDLVADKNIVSLVDNYSSPPNAPDPETWAVILEDPHTDFHVQANGVARVRLRVVA